MDAGDGELCRGIEGAQAFEVIAEELGIKTEDVVKDRDGSYILAKGGGNL